MKWYYLIFVLQLLYFHICLDYLIKLMQNWNWFLRKEKCWTIFLLFLPSGHLSEFRNCVFVLRCKLKDFYLSTMSDARKRESWQILMEGDAQTRVNTVTHSFRKNWSYVNFLTFYQTYIVATIFLVNWYRVIENL